MHKPIVLCAVVLICSLCVPGVHAQSGYTILHNFAGGPGDGSDPRGNLISDGGTLYGMTREGGATAEGTIFSLNSDGTGYTVLYSFAGPPGDGWSPYGSLISDGTKLYGMTREGGAYYRGALFSLNSDGTAFTLIHDFAGPPLDGQNPFGSLILDGGKLYGMTVQGGSNSTGTIFSLNSDGSGYTVIHDFGAVGDGRNPYGSLISDGSTLYGMTENGKYAYGRGTIFSVGTDGSNYTLLHQFDGLTGASPHGSLISDGSKLYGMTSYGGANIGIYGYGAGTVFSMKPDGSGFTVLHNFDIATDDGSYPWGDLVVADGRLFGMARESVAGGGTIFSINPDGSGFSLVHAFAGSPIDGGSPFGSLISDGSTLYGMTSRGGAFGYYYAYGTGGTIFSLSIPPAPTATPLPSVDVVVSSSNPQAGDLFTVDVTIQPINRSFDLWGVIIGNGKIFSFDLTNPSNLIPGGQRLLRNVPNLPAAISRRLYQGTILLPAAAGTWDVIVGLTPAGSQPLGTQDAIPGYVDTETVVVTP
jgi:uncharacterized repeat protein (TIGR03803 family)